MSGFSLVELIMSVAVLGILVSLAIMTMPYIYGAVTETHDQRNAQELVTVYESAQAAGLNFAGPDLDTTVHNIVNGGTPTDGAFRGQTFMLNGLTAQDMAGAETYLSFANGALTYNSAGTH